ncbi:MAG: site-2 protease family protein [Actinomycetota bacterium]
MHESFRIAEVRGIPVGMHWSLLIVFALVAVALSGGLLPATVPDQEPVAYGLAGVVTTLAFFGSVLAHELGHALLAQRRGVEVTGITLWLFGGVARFRTQPQDPTDDLHIAAVGPAISVALAVAFGALGLAVSATGAAPLASAGLGWLGLINAALAVFNMVPAAPLDGGRVLRAWLWRRKGDYGQATRLAARGGRVFGLVLVLAGLFEAAFGRLGGLWLVLIGWFLITAARGEETSSWLSGLRVGEVMTPDPVVAPDWLTVQHFLDDYVFAHRFSTFPLRDFQGGLSGLVTLGAVKRVPAERRNAVRVREVAVPIAEVPQVAPDTPLEEASSQLSPLSGGRALVFDDGELVGILSPSDLSRAIERGPLRRRDEREADAAQPTGPGAPSEPGEPTGPSTRR